MGLKYLLKKEKRWGLFGQGSFGLVLYLLSLRVEMNLLRVGAFHRFPKSPSVWDKQLFYIFKNLFSAWEGRLSRDCGQVPSSPHPFCFFFWAAASVSLSLVKVTPCPVGGLTSSQPCCSSAAALAKKVE